MYSKVCLEYVYKNTSFSLIFPFPMAVFWKMVCTHSRIIAKPNDVKPEKLSASTGNMVTLIEEKHLKDLLCALDFLWIGVLFYEQSHDDVAHWGLTENCGYLKPQTQEACSSEEHDPKNEFTNGE
jgi:hypothetical protein